MQTESRTVQASVIRQELNHLHKEISSITPIKVMGNPMKIQETALRTTLLMGRMLDLIEAQTPYADEVQTLYSGAS